MTKTESLLGGRNTAPLSDDEVRRVMNTFLGLDDQREWDVRHTPSSRTVFVIEKGERGEERGAIVFGPDIYPGNSVANPNSLLSMKAAAAHELTHLHRWNDKVELPVGKLDHIDEAMTSLQAALRYERKLSEVEIRELIADAMERLRLFVSHQGSDSPNDAP